MEMNNDVPSDATRVYISLPITGRKLAQVKNRANVIKQLFSTLYIDAITPFDVAPEPDKPYSYYMGKCIEALIDCDAVYFVNDWETSRGCRCEHATAKIYGKSIMYQSKRV